MEFARADAVNQAIRMLSLRHRARAAAMLAPLGLHPGQEVFLLELARRGQMIQAQLSEALGCEPPTVTQMTRRLEASGYIRREPAATDKRVTMVALTSSGEAIVDSVKQIWCELADETVEGLSPATVDELSELLRTLSNNVDTKRADRPQREAARQGRAVSESRARP